MITVTPQGRICLCKSPLENDYNNQLTFSSATTQMNYFNSIVYKTYDNYTYLKKDNVVKVSENIDAIRSCNYLFYQNRGFSNKTYFCFITNMEYVNENCTAITFETDCFQTYQFDLEYKPCFVEREIVAKSNDIAGKYTIPEGLELGEPVLSGDSASYNLSTGSTQAYAYCFQATDLPSKKTRVSSNETLYEWLVTQSTTHRRYNGIGSGTYFFAVLSQQDVEDVVKGFAYDGKSDAIVSLFYAPIPLVSGEGNTHACYVQQTDNTYKTVTILEPPESSSAYELATLTVNKPTQLDGYTPKNAKLFTFPYCYLQASNNSGQTYEYRFEDFAQSTCQFKVMGALCQGTATRMQPIWYKNQGASNNNTYLADYSVSGGKLPTMSWNNDYYLNWIAQNSGTVASTLATSIGHSMLATTMPNKKEGLITAGVGVASAVIDTMAQLDKQQRLPDQAGGNTNAGDINFSLKTCGFNVKSMSLRHEMAVIVDDFMSMFGYKINTVKVPDIDSRSNWNYVKTVECNVEGDIPQDDLDVVRGMFNKGVTLWHNPSTMYNYNVDNN